MAALMLTTITLTAETPSSACFSPQIIPDSRIEPDEIFLIYLNSNSPVNINPFNSVITIVILNDDCESLPNPFNGQVTLSGTAAGSIATYTCELGLIGGDLIRVCQNDGTWSGVEAICQSKHKQIKFRNHGALKNYSYICLI